jgi:hypothetical protein
MFVISTRCDYYTARLALVCCLDYLRFKCISTQHFLTASLRQRAPAETLAGVTGGKGAPDEICMGRTNFYIVEFLLAGAQVDVPFTRRSFRFLVRVRSMLN